MHTENALFIRADPDRIYQLAADIRNWPRLLPHYRYVVVEEESQSHRIARMGARRTGFPVSWRARQELDPRARRIRYHHIGGITRGMDVEWGIEPHEGGATVWIVHDLEYLSGRSGPIAWAARQFGRHIVGGLFVHHIADQTLACIRWAAELERCKAAAS